MRFNPLRLLKPSPVEPSAAEAYLDRLRARSEEAERVLARTDHTNAVLAALATALLVAGAAGVGVTGADAALSSLPQAVMAAALVGVAASLAVLVAAILPRRGVTGHSLSGVPLYASLDSTQLAETVRRQSAEAYYLDRILTVSRIAAAKHRQQRVAIVLMLAAVVVLVAAILLATLR